MKKTMMTIPSNHYILSLVAGVFISIALITYGWVITPGVKLLSVAGAYVIVLGYAFFIVFLLPKTYRSNSKIVKHACYTGLLAGLAFTGMIVSEYIILPDDNTFMGLLEYGSVFLLFFVSSVVFTLRNDHFRHTPLTALISGVVGSLIWIMATLLVFYLFYGTPRQELVFLAEGNDQDFVRSGMEDFHIFIMEDFFGAVFFHSILIPLMASLLGTLGGGITTLVKWLLTNTVHRQRG